MDQRETAQFRASAGTLQGFGATPQQSLQALMERLPTEVPAPIVIWPYNRGDVYFTDVQHGGFEESGMTEEELDAFIEAEVKAYRAEKRDRAPQNHE